MTRRTNSRLCRAAALLAACALAASLSSCGRSDPVQEEIDRVAIGLGAISTSGSTPLPSVENRRQVYQWAINRLSGRGGSINMEGVKTDGGSSVSAVTSSNTGQAAAANLLVARGHAGLGEIEAQEAARLEASASYKISPILTALDQWLTLNVSADAYAAYDPAPELAAIEQQIGAKQKLADDARAAKDRQQAVIDGLEKDSADAMGRSRALREQAAEIRGRATNVSETERLDLITEAVRVGREADQIEKDAATLLARVDVEKPSLEALQKGIDELSTQIQLLRADKDTVRQRSERSAEAAKNARDAARAAADRVMQLLGELTKAREALAEPTEAAIKAYSDAAGAARKAQSAKETKVQAYVATGNYQHALADVLTTQARGQAAFAELLNRLASARPALPNAADLQGRATAATEAAKASRDRAKEALQAALTAYGTGGGSGDTQERLDALERSLNDLLGNQPEAADAPMEEAPMGDEAPAEEPAAEPAPAETGGGEGEPGAGGETGGG